MMPPLSFRMWRPLNLRSRNVSCHLARMDPKLARQLGGRSIPLGGRQGHFGLECHPENSPLPGHRPAPDRVPPATETPPYQGARKLGSISKSTELIVDETIGFIRAHKDRPFYINVWTLLPHALLHPTPEQLAVYADLMPSPAAPGFGPWMRDYLGRANDLRSQMQIFCASITDLDTQVGRLLDALDEAGLTDDTILIYSSDNGPEDYRIGNASNAGVGSTGPLRARKRSMHEGGIRTFGLVRWPGRVLAGRRDETSVTAAVDFLPTICKLAGVSVPAGANPDGEDVSDIWLGRQRPRRKPLHWEWLFTVEGVEEGCMPPPLAIREGDWKLFCDHQGVRAELYDIPKDAGEERDVAGDHPELVAELTRKALAWVDTLPPSPARDRMRTTGMPPERPQRRAPPTQPAASGAR